MSAYTIENLLLRMKSVTSATSLTFVLLSGLVACSSKNGAISDVSTRDGEVSALDSQDDLGDGLEMTSIDQTSQVDGMSSLPVKKSNKKYSYKSSTGGLNISNWGGKLHTQYSPDMKEWIVARGESLSLIAQGVFGNKNSLNKLLALNPQIVDSNVLSVGQVINLPFTAQADQAEELVKTTPVDAAPATQVNVDDIKAKDSLAIVSNAPTADAAGMGEASANLPSDAQAQGAMETVPVAAAASPAPSVDNSAVMPDAASSVEAPAGTSAIVQKVAKVSKKGNLKTGLMVGAIGFLVLSAIVFMLSRKKA